jgi:hypothetical protein
MGTPAREAKNTFSASLIGAAIRRSVMETLIGIPAARASVVFNQSLLFFIMILCFTVMFFDKQ